MIVSCVSCLSASYFVVLGLLVSLACGPVFAACTSWLLLRAAHCLCASSKMYDFWCVHIVVATAMSSLFCPVRQQGGQQVPVV